MAVRGRRRQKNLAPKLRKIRSDLELSQSGLRNALNLVGISNSSVSEYESGRMEPPLWVLLKYAEAARICLDTLIDDRLELPPEVPAKKFYCPHCKK